MKIGPRISLLFLPLLLLPVFAITLASTRAAREGIATVVHEFLAFKSDELLRFAARQYALLEDNGFADDAAFVDAAESSIAGFARGLIRSDTELILAMDAAGDIVFATGDVDASQTPSRASYEDGQWHRLRIAGVPRVVMARRFAPFEWTILTTETEASLFSPIAAIVRTSAIVAVVSMLAAAALVIVFSRLITRPIAEIVDAMGGIVERSDLSARVETPYQDEIGELADAFNSMTDALERAYGELERFAVTAATTRMRETKVRHVFQKYVPQQVVEEFFASPEAMLEGENRRLTVLFSDIRGFTSMSEALSSQEVVRRLNRYFSRMVELIMERQGVVDKYMGDGIMAFFGAPVQDRSSRLHAAQSALAMLDEVERLNAESADQTGIRVGIGISFGDATVGNIGSERKMDYTVVGDVVNVASRLEGLTKTYGVPILVTDAVRESVADEIVCRTVDRVRVKGRREPLDISTILPHDNVVDDAFEEAYDAGITAYLQRDFERAVEQFTRALEINGDDALAEFHRGRSERLARDGVSDDWDGVTVYDHK